MSLTNSDRLWRLTATLWIVLVPCLWWRGMTQDAVQGLAWHVGTVVLLLVSLSREPVRPWKMRWSELALFAGAVGSSLFHFSGGYSLLVLNSLMAWLGVFCLVKWAPDARWITRRLVWLAWANLGYWLLQHTGYDPLFETAYHPSMGLFSKANQLAVLWLVSMPWCPWLCVPLVLLRNATAWALLFWWSLRGLRGKVDYWGWLVGAGLFGCAWWCARPSVWAMKVVPRLAVWKALVGQAVWSPAWGYGLHAWRAMTPFPGDPIAFNGYLDALHAGGLLFLVPIAWVAWDLWRDRPSDERTALLCLGEMALTQDVWNFPRLVVVTIALYAALTIRRQDADRPGPGAVPHL